MFPFFFDPTMMLLIPALILAMWAQFRVKSVFARYSQVGSRRGTTAASAARALLDRFGLTQVRERVATAYGGRGQVSVQTAPGAGCTVSIELPLEPIP